MNLYNDLETYDKDSNGANITTLRVIIEIPKGSLIKYELEPKGRFLTAVRAMDDKYPYAYNYGAIPQTLGGDEDPLDAIVLYREAIHPGTVLNCKIIGVIRTIDRGEQDDKILCIPYFDKTSSVNIKKILKYLKEYKYPEVGTTQIGEVLGIRKAKEIISLAIENYKKAVRMDDIK